MRIGYLLRNVHEIEWPMNHACSGEFIRLWRINPPLLMLNLFHAHSLRREFKVKSFAMRRVEADKSLRLRSANVIIKLTVLTVKTFCLSRLKLVALI